MTALITILAAGIVAWWAFLFLVQRRMLFPAPISAGSPARPPEAEQVWLTTPGARTEAWLLRPTVAAPADAPLLIFAHGNGELIDYWGDGFEDARRRGFAVLLVEYPGYGRSSGRPAERSIAATIIAAYDWAVAQPGIDRGRVIAVGRSLGGGAAAILARERPVAALVLESSFSSVRAFARGFGAPGFLVRDPFDTRDRLQGYRGPILLLHGERDEVIPVEHAHALAAAAPGAVLALLPCGHNDCPSSWPHIEAFLARHGLLRASGVTPP